MESRFQIASEGMKKADLGAIPDKQKLELYKYFKQATEGDCNIPKPGMFSLKAKKKWEFWNTLKGMSKEEAMEKYVQEASKYLPPDELAKLN